MLNKRIPIMSNTYEVLQKPKVVTTITATIKKIIKILDDVSVHLIDKKKIIFQ
jgi:hypothetical protein